MLRVFYMEPDSDWVTNKNLLSMKYFYRDHLHLIKEGYKKLAKTISVSLMNAYPYTQDNAKQSYYPPLKDPALSVNLLVTHPFKSPICPRATGDRTLQIKKIYSQ